ncbi:hypothetical protein A3765_10565 [Oleiphilus sp. HI0130]|nr:hypothetical protein A3765_22235 [Oleiphilus sp. HI0130]KZZ75277.1 hypothetical protein A3765_10565 [Oleiphilus sp. HI0130]
MFKLSGKSLQRLGGVHPDLVRLTKRAIERSPVDFGITEGVRSYERQVQLVQAKKSTTLHSLHLVQEHTGYGHAIDIFAYVGGKATWSPKYYGPIIQTFITEAAILGIQTEFGLLWKDFTDAPHIQLNRKFY